MEIKVKTNGKNKVQAGELHTITRHRQFLFDNTDLI